jgi:hypothetical protein
VARYDVHGRHDRVVLENASEAELAAWKDSLSGLVSSGALTRVEKFAIEDEQGRIENWRPSRAPGAAATERSRTNVY